MGKDGKEQQNIKDWIPVDSLKQKTFDKESSVSSSSGVSSGGSSPHAEAGTSPSNAINLEPERLETSKRRRVSGSDEEPRPAKQARITETVIYCCQCHMMHVRKLNENCSNCVESHVFCENCETKVQYRKEI